MSRTSHQKLKLYYLKKIMLERTDADHFLSMEQIIEALREVDIAAERKSIYRDLEELENLGVSVENIRKGKGSLYHVVKRPFSMAELKLLVDAIQSSKFITEENTNGLIQKLEGFVSRYEARQLTRQVFVRGRVKTRNDQVLDAVDVIHNALDNMKQIRFQYFNWNSRKQMELRHDGAYYEVSPWSLTWDDENYYLIGFDAKDQKIKHYRVDKMIHISMMDKPREGRELFEKFNLADYAKQTFGMFGGELREVKLEFENSMASVVMDRFGMDGIFIPKGDDHTTTWVKVAISPQFFAWIFSLGRGVKIVEPADVVEKAREEIQRLQEMYR